MDVDESQKIDEKSSSASLRSADQNSWVRNFQSHLKDLNNGISTSSTYTLEEATFGLEYLFNYAYADVNIGSNKNGIKKSFGIPENKDWLALYNDINDHIISIQTEGLAMDFVSIEPNLETNEVGVYSNFKLPNPTILEQYPISEAGSTTCDNPPFTNEEFLVGYDGRNDRDFWFPCPIEELPACGDNPAGTRPETVALEAIEAFQNASIRNSQLTCEEPEVLFFSDIGTIKQSQISMTDITRACTELTYDEMDLVGAHDCVASNALNCISCFTSNLLISDEILDRIPDGTEIIDIDLFISWIGNNNFPQFYTATITYAKVECVTRHHEEPIDIECC